MKKQHDTNSSGGERTVSIVHNNFKNLFPLWRHIAQTRNDDKTTTTTTIEREHHNNMALLDRSELVLGQLLGKGAFCLVYELQDVHLDPTKVVLHPYHNHNHNNSISQQRQRKAWWDDENNNNNNNNTLYQMEKTREYIQKHCQSQTNDDDGDDDDDHWKNDNDSSLLLSSPTSRTTTTSCRRPRYVIKHLRPNLAIDRGYKVFQHAAKDLRREYDILSQLSHPNIVQLFGRSIPKEGIHPDDEDEIQDEEVDDFFLLLERLDSTLTERIQYWKGMTICPSPLFNGRQRHINHHYDVPAFYIEKVKIALDVASALMYIHEHHFVFRDLKPDNIALSLFHGTPIVTAKLIDFGLCRGLPTTTVFHKNVSSSSRRGRKVERFFRMSGVGTRRYMAPEMILGRAYNQKVDCYSWAMVFYEMLTHQKPFASYNREIHKLLLCENHDRPCLNSSSDNKIIIPHEAQILLKHAWAQQPSDRASMKEVYDDLTILLDCAIRQSMSCQERSLQAVMEMAELLTMESSSYNKKEDDDSLFLRQKSNAELTVSTANSSTCDEFWFSRRC